MVVKINLPAPHCSTSVQYNESKVVADKASVLFTMNIPETETPLSIFERYERSSIRCEKLSFHMSIDPGPDDKMSDKEIAGFAKKLMGELGYTNQPYVVYKHEDIKRVHYHIVSVRVDEKGRKINDYKEGRKCFRALHRFAKEFGYKVGKEQKDSREQVFGVYKGFTKSAGNHSAQFEQIVALVMKYDITTEAQFRMVLNSLNVDVDYRKKKGEEYMVFYGLDPKTKQRYTGGISSKKLNVPDTALIQKHITSCKKSVKKKEKGRVASIARSLLPHSSSETHFRRMLEKKGISVCFSRTSDNKIYGVTFIDHHTKCCFKASELPNISASLFEEARFSLWLKDEKEQTRNVSPIDYTEDVIGLVQGLISSGGGRKNEDEEMMRRGRRRKR